jgi:general secretion pathway protein A
MFLDYYKLTDEPFGATPDPKFLYLSAQHREALASLAYATESNRGFLAFIAKPGMGKTSLLFKYLEGLRGKARTAFVFRTDCDSREFVRHVLLDLEVDVTGKDLAMMHETLNRILVEEMRAGRRFVLVVDEAQNLGENVLESIRLLSNFETPCLKLMLIVLVGQPGLANLLASPSLAQLRQRISMIIRLEPFSEEEVNAYINHRLSGAGGKNPSLFTRGARKMIAEHSLGIPRNINNICFNALSLGYALQRETIDREIIREVIADLDLAPLMEKNDDELRSKAGPKQNTITPSDTIKKKSITGNWISKLAIASVLLLTVAGPAGDANGGKSKSVKTPANAAPPVVASLIPPRSSANASPLIEQTQDLIHVVPGQTLYHISVENFGHFSIEIFEEFRRLNPWLTNPNYIESGQDLRIPSSTLAHQNVRHAAEQVDGWLTKEAERQ